MELSRENMMKKGNGSLAVSILFFFSSLACPCPLCIGAACAGFLNSAREKLSIGPKFPVETGDAGCRECRGLRRPVE